MARDMYRSDHVDLSLSAGLIHHSRLVSCGMRPSFTAQDQTPESIASWNTKVLFLNGLQFTSLWSNQ